jgi:hypothetical protein
VFQPEHKRGNFMSTSDTTERLAYRSKEFAAMIGVSVSGLRKMISDGVAPKADIRRRKLHLWRRETIRRWLASQARQTRAGGK